MTGEGEGNEGNEVSSSPLPLPLPPFFALALTFAQWLDWKRLLRRLHKSEPTMVSATPRNTQMKFMQLFAFLSRVGKDAMEISYLVGIATRGFNTEFQLKEVRGGWGRVLMNKIVWCKKQAPVVQKVDNPLDKSLSTWIAQLFVLILIRWIVIYLRASSRRSDSRVRENSNRRARAKLARSPPSKRGSLLSERLKQSIYAVDSAIHCLNIRGQDNTCVTYL